MIERCRTPGSRAVTDIALLREAGRNMVRVIRVLKISQVAAHASRGRDVVVAIHMALAALQPRVGTRQGPPGGRVIEGSGVPVRRGMADLALLWESGRGVVRITCILKVLQMATDTSGRGQIVVAVRVALRALHAGMRAREREARF